MAASDVEKAAVEAGAAAAGAVADAGRAPGAAAVEALADESALVRVSQRLWGTRLPDVPMRVVSESQALGVERGDAAYWSMTLPLLYAISAESERVLAAVSASALVSADAKSGPGMDARKLRVALDALEQTLSLAAEERQAKSDAAHKSMITLSESRIVEQVEQLLSMPSRRGGGGGVDIEALAQVVAAETQKAARAVGLEVAKVDQHAMRDAVRSLVDEVVRGMGQVQWVYTVTAGVCIFLAGLGAGVALG